LLCLAAFSLKISSITSKKIEKSKPIKKVNTNETIIKENTSIETVEKSIPIETITNANGFKFRGEFSNHEINLVSSYTTTTRGYFLQTHNDKVIISQWVKSEPRYDTIKQELLKDSNINGEYKSYLIWYSDVIKIIVNSKFKY